jgi:hypothetical protein
MQHILDFETFLHLEKNGHFPEEIELYNLIPDISTSTTEQLSLQPCSARKK